MDVEEVGEAEVGAAEVDVGEAVDVHVEEVVQEAVGTITTAQTQVAFMVVGEVAVEAVVALEVVVLVVPPEELEAEE